MAWLSVQSGAAMKWITVGGRPFAIHSDEREAYWDEGTSRSVMEGNEYLLREWVDSYSRYFINTVFDLGANIGAFSCLARNLFPNAHIVAVEAHPDNIPYLTANCGNDPKTTIVPRAVLGIPCPSVVMLDKLDYNGGGWTLATSGTEIQTVSIVDLFNKHVPEGRDLDLLKIDTEGCETCILRGLARFSLLRRVNFIRLEWHGRKSIVELRALLRRTHDVWIDTKPLYNGILVASRKVQ